MGKKSLITSKKKIKDSNHNKNNINDKNLPKVDEKEHVNDNISDSGANGMNIDDIDMYQEPLKKIVIPDNQLKLDEQELKQEFTRVLTGNDPNVPNNITKYNYKERMFKIDPPGPGDNLFLHLSIKGSTMHKASEEAKAQAAFNVKKIEDEREAREMAVKEAREEAESKGEKFDESSFEFDTGKNQFNYSERACQTYTNPLRQRSVETEPPPILSFFAAVTQWDIYDSYMESYEKSQLEQGQIQKVGTQQNEKDEENDKKKSNRNDDMVHSAAMSNKLKVIERMVNQNQDDEIFQDFKYWEDASDQFREGEGTLLPLWRFSYDRVKKKQVTALCWNTSFPDLFAVGYGSYEFLRQGSGMVCCYTLKNTSFPEYSFASDSGIMCLDFHPQHPALIAAGCYDGTVMVFDVRNKVSRPIYKSTIRTGKHTDPVWQVKWQEEDLAKELNFFSISSDGRVANWIMSKNELKMELVMQLKLVSSIKNDPEEAALSGLASGCSIDFNKFSEHLFIVGTEEGKIHKCSKAYSGQYLENYEGHHMTVYTVRWNPYHPNVFISCSADWTVKIWDHTLNYPIMSFDLGNAVGDIAWAPYSSTVFAAVTNDGKVHVFDLAQNKHEPICEQKVVKRSKLTHVVFNERDPILLVGDDNGGVNSLKLSPNLRKIEKYNENSGNNEEGNNESNNETSEEIIDPIKWHNDREIEKMEKLLNSLENKPEM